MLAEGEWANKAWNIKMSDYIYVFKKTVFAENFSLILENTH